MTSDLSGRHVVVTGAAGDIGRAMVLELHRRGARVTGLGRHEPDDDSLRVDGIAFRRADVTDRAALRAVLEDIPPFDVVVGNAGISDAAPFLEITDAQWEWHLDVNLTGNFHLGQEAARLMIARGAPGHIVFTGSWVQEVPWPEIAAYSASKGGLVMLMRSMALELARHDIRVNVIAPGIVAAGMAKHQMDTEPQYARRVSGIVPLGRMQTVEDVARATAFLCSDDANYMTGATLLVDGGASLFQFTPPEV